jgi:hypothetical protein
MIASTYLRHNYQEAIQSMPAKHMHAFEGQCVSASWQLHLSLSNKEHAIPSGSQTSMIKERNFWIGNP